MSEETGKLGNNIASCTFVLRRGYVRRLSLTTEAKAAGSEPRDYVRSSLEYQFDLKGKVSQPLCYYCSVLLILPGFECSVVH